MALPKYVDDYKPFNQQQKKDFYDLMTPHWSNEMAKQYNIEAEEEEHYKEVMRLDANMNLNFSKPDAINPSHYQGIVGNYQYIECMEFILGFDGLKAHLIGQIYKYMMRLGKKDADLQEVGKVVWYSRCLEILLRDGTIIGKLDELK
jgi:hypothetical protein